MSSASCLAPPAPRLPCPRVGLPPPSAAPAARSSLGFRPRRAAPAKGWKLWHVSCFRNDQDGPTTSDDGSGFMYVAQSERPRSADVEEEEEVGGSSGEQGQNYKDRGWFLQVQKIKDNLHGTILRFQTQRWTVPWTGQTIAQRWRDYYVRA